MQPLPGGGLLPAHRLELTRLCTHAPSGSECYGRAERLAPITWRPIYAYRQFHIGYLPQDAPPSPMLSNLIMRETDNLIAALARRAGLTYTRYSDDITFSTTGGIRPRESNGSRLENHRDPAPCRTTGEQKEDAYCATGARKVVLGLLVDDEAPRLTREFRDRLRQHLYYLEKLGPETHRAARHFDTVSGLYRHVRGLIDFANSVDTTFAAAMRAKFDAVSWSLDVADDG